MIGVTLKRLLMEPPRYGLNITPDRYQDNGIRLVRTSDVGESGPLNDESGVYLDPADVPNDMLLGTGDVLFSRSGTVGRAFLYDEEKHGPATYAGFLVRFRLRAGIDPRALRYWSNSAQFLGAVESGSIQSTIANFNAERYANLEVPGPIVAESRAIADRLDAETARIDGTIATRQRTLQLLGQRRRTFLANALNGALAETNAAIAQADWRPLRAFVEVRLGRARSPDTAEGDCMVPYLRAANVKDGRLDLETILEMNFTPQEQAKYRLLPGDVLITEGAGSLNAVGASAVWSGEREGVVCFQNHLLRLRATERAEPRFVAWWARFAYETRLLGSLATGAQILNLGAEDVRSLPVRFPDRGSQAGIADLLDERMSSIEASLAQVDRQIDLLRERRLALITAAVTGQIEIPGFAA